MIPLHFDKQYLIIFIVWFVFFWMLYCLTNDFWFLVEPWSVIARDEGACYIYISELTSLTIIPLLATHICFEFV